MKQILKILSFVWLFLLFMTQSFAFDANLSTTKTNLNIDDYLNLRLEVNSSEWWEIEVVEIKWIENFQKVWQSQSQSSSSQVVIVNWDTKSKTITTINLDLQLKPLKNWEFVIWPAILQSGSWTIETNSVKVKIDWTSIWIWTQNSPIIPFHKEDKDKNKISGQTQRSDPTAKNVGVNPSVHPEINLDDYKWNNYELYILFLVLLLSGIWFYFLLKNKPEIIENINKKKDSWNNIETEQKQDFEVKKEKIKYPKTDDTDFIKKAEIALRQKLKQKYNINNINSLTFSELEKEIPNKLDLTELFAMINKAKYSNIITDFSKILEKIKEI